MYSPYHEKCRNCPLAGEISKPVNNSDELRFIECLRDSEDAKEHLIRTGENENYLWLRQEVELKDCIYYYEITNKSGANN
jgi:hypothetical protein